MILAAMVLVLVLYKFVVDVPLHAPLLSNLGSRSNLNFVPGASVAGPTAGARCR